MARRCLLGTMNKAVIGLAGSLVVAAYIFSWTVVASPPNGMPEILDVVPVLGFASGLFFLIVTSRVVGDEAGYVDMVSFLVTRRVPAEQIAEIQATDGLRLVLISGRRIGTVAYGTSLLGQLVKYPRSMRAAERVSAFIASLPVDVKVADSERMVETSVRWRATLGAVSLGAVLFAGTVAIHMLQTR